MTFRFWAHAIQFEPKAAQLSMHVPQSLLDAVKERARHRGIAYTRFIRELMEREISRPQKPLARRGMSHFCPRLGHGGRLMPASMSRTTAHAAHQEPGATTWTGSNVNPINITDYQLNQLTRT